MNSSNPDPNPTPTPTASQRELAVALSQTMTLTASVQRYTVLSQRLEADLERQVGIHPTHPTRISLVLTRSLSHLFLSNFLLRGTMAL